MDGWIICISRNTGLHIHTKLLFSTYEWKKWTKHEWEFVSHIDYSPVFNYLSFHFIFCIMIKQVKHPQHILDDLSKHRSRCKRPETDRAGHSGQVSGSWILEQKGRTLGPVTESCEVFKRPPSGHIIVRVIWWIHIRISSLPTPGSPQLSLLQIPCSLVGVWPFLGKGGHLSIWTWEFKNYTGTRTIIAIVKECKNLDLPAKGHT